MTENLIEFRAHCDLVALGMLNGKKIQVGLIPITHVIYKYHKKKKCIMMLTLIFFIYLGLNQV